MVWLTGPGSRGEIFGPLTRYTFCHPMRTISGDATIGRVTFGVDLRLRLKDKDVGAKKIYICCVSKNNGIKTHKERDKCWRMR